jgi:predicted NUDIX family phosphoesterase
MAEKTDDIIGKLEREAGDIRRLLDARTAKRPLIIEFSGSPKSGKTTAINVLSLFFRRNGFRVETFTERASISPIAHKKGHPDFNVWVSCASLQGVIESAEKVIDLFILDRGIFDALVWNRHHALTGKITKDEADAMAAFFTMDRWTRLIDLVCIMKCSPDVSIDREYANQLTRKPGTIMTEGTLQVLNNAIDDALARFGPKFKKTLVIDTTHTDTKEGATLIAMETLTALRTFLDESLCVLHRSKLPRPLPEKGFVRDEKAAREFIGAVADSSEFVPRSKAEYDPQYLIPIPCAVIRFGSKVLILKRKEEGHALHDTYAIWAGGHVVGTDAGGKDMILDCLQRELMEELYIQGEYTLRPIGIVKTDKDERASRHIGVVFDAELSNDTVALALDQKEFRERRGTSVSGTLVEVNGLEPYFPKMGDWSKSIVQEMWPRQIGLFQEKEDVHHSHARKRNNKGTV